MLLTFLPTDTTAERTAALGDAWRALWKQMPHGRRLKSDILIMLHCNAVDIPYDGTNTEELNQATSATITAE